MTDNKQQILSEIVKISRQYQRSIRVDTDIGRVDALSTFICHTTAESVIDSMSKQLLNTNQRSFTWTGPFGGGKSSLAIALASSLNSDKTLRDKARNILHLDSKPNFDKVFPVRDGWLVVPVVGRRASIVTSLTTALLKAQCNTDRENKKSNAQSLINELLKESKKRPHDGVLVIIDEMGKFLEATALGQGDDVYFFQELAEAAARSEGRLVIIGVLHQSFAQYSARLGIDTREDWTKVQGRFVDLPFVTASDEVVELIGRAIETKCNPEWVFNASKVIADSIGLRRPAIGQGFTKALAKCWPLHPAMAALLGPISKRQFGQNERSTFGFLSSVESNGFQSYLKTTSLKPGAWYRPNDYWDYLRSNLEPAILSSPDGHRWSQAVEAVDRAEARTNDSFAVALLKNIAVIDLFRNGSGLAADSSVIESLFPDKTHEELESALLKLSDLQVAIHKSYTGSWSVFEGSDFDINTAIKESLAASPDIDYTHLSKVVGLRPIVAKRHYHTSGSMRWMDLRLCSIEQAEKFASGFSPTKGEFGVFVLAFPTLGTSFDETVPRAQACARLRPWPVIVGIPSNYTQIQELSSEILAIEQVKKRHELSGDPVARREVNARLAAISSDLEDHLQKAISLTYWYNGEAKISISSNGSKLSPLASELAEGLFHSAPSIWSELVNRDNLSSSSVKARRNLLYAMIKAENQPDLGFKGFPAERGLYETLLKKTGLHQKNASGTWQFTPPGNKVAGDFLSLWRKTKTLFLDASILVGVREIYSLWSAPPFGIKQGVLPVVLTAFILAHKSHIAVYKDGMFVPKISDFDIDECLQDHTRFSLRWVVIDEDKSRILEGIARLLEEIGESQDIVDPLDAARGLVSMVFNLPDWTRRTQRLSDIAKAIRDMLLKANDPHKVLFVDLPTLLNTSDSEAYIDVLRAPLYELINAYGKMLALVGKKMFEALDVNQGDWKALNLRARSVSGISGDFRLDAFATRLASFDGSQLSLEGILSLAVEKPPRDWVDRHIDAAYLELAKFSRHFRETEAFVSIQGREPHSAAIALVIGAGSDTRTISRSFSISEQYNQTIDNKVEEINNILEMEGLNRDVLLAILAKVGIKLLSSDKEIAND